MTAGKAVIVGFRSEKRSGSNAMVEVLQRSIEQYGADHGNGKPDGSAPPAKFEQDHKGDRHFQQEDLIAQKRNDLHRPGHAGGGKLVGPGTDSFVKAKRVPGKHFTPKPCK